MVQPAKLWESSRQVLGPLADLYGEIEPIPPERIAFQETVELESGPLRVLQTPGHAPHHLSFLAGDCLFAGEVAGVTCPLERGFYLRPATPPVFDLETQMRSLEKVASLDISTVYLGHYGIRHDPQSLFSHAKAQIPRWLGIMETHLRRKSEPFEEFVFNDILAQDPCMDGYKLLPKDIKVRERDFISNSIRGMKGYLLKNLPQQ
jgi:glyoxylase-like metal-dependent hydrolase (beta-lactamase superfamily II)